MAELIPYNAAHTLYFPLVASGTQALSNAASGSLVGTNIIYSIDGGAFASSTNTGTFISDGWYKVVLDASETTGEQIIVKIAGGTLGTVVEAQNFIFKTYGNDSGFYPSNVLGTALSAQTIGTVSQVLTGTVTTITAPGTYDANLVSILATAVVATSGTLTNVGTVGTALGTITASGTVTASTLLNAGTPAVNLVSILGTAAVATAGTLTNVGTAGTVLGTQNVNVIEWSGTAVDGTDGTPYVTAVNVWNSTERAMLRWAAGIDGAQTAPTGPTSTGNMTVNVVNIKGTAAAGTQGTLGVSIDLLTTAQATLAGVPAASTNVPGMISWMYSLSRNQVDQTTGTQIVYNDGGTAIATAIVTDDGGSFRRANFA